MNVTYVFAAIAVPAGYDSCLHFMLNTSSLNDAIGSDLLVIVTTIDVLRKYT